MPGCGFGYRFSGQPVTAKTLAPLGFPANGYRLQLTGQTLGACARARARVCDFHFQPVTCNHSSQTLMNKGFRRFQVFFKPVTEPVTSSEAHAAARSVSAAGAKEFPLSAEVFINNGSGK